MWTRLAPRALAAAAVVAALASPVADAVSDAAPVGPFIVNQALAPATLDPSEAANIDDGGFISNLYVTLTKHGTKKGKNGYPESDYSKIVPYLAKSWKVLDGGRTYVFTLRRAVFPDGSPMDANAVKYSFDRLLARGATGAYFMNAQNGAGFVTGVEAPNKTTVIVRLKAKSQYARYEELHTYVDLGIVNPRVVEAHGGITRTPNQWMATHSAGGGPYVLQEYDPNRRAVLVANPRFFGTKPLEKRVIVNFIPSDSTLLFQASAGRAHVTVGMTKQAVASLRRNTCCKIVANGFPNYVSLALPNLMPPFNNREFRRALSYAVPYAGIRNTVMFGYADLYYGLFPPAFTNFNPAVGKPRAFSVARARQMIQQSGANLPVDLDVIVREGENDWLQIAAIIKATWAPLGINVNIKTLAAGQYLTARGTPKRNYAIFTRYQLAFGEPAWILAGDLLCNLSVVNNSDYCNPAVDALVGRLLDMDPSKRQPLWNQIERIWIQDAPRIPLHQAQYVVVLKNGVRNYEFGTAPLHLWTWGR